jgi:hypothetical protein
MNNFLIFFLNLILINCTASESSSTEKYQDFQDEIQNNLIYNELRFINDLVMHDNLTLKTDIEMMASVDKRNNMFLDKSKLISIESEKLFEYLNMIEETVIRNYKSYNTPIQKLSPEESAKILKKSLYDSGIVEDLVLKLVKYKDFLLENSFSQFETFDQDLSILLSPLGSEESTWEDKYFKTTVRISGIICNIEVIRGKIILAENMVLKNLEQNCIRGH